MLKIRCGDKIGVDIDQVVAWKLYTPDKQRGETLALFFLAAGDTLHISRNLVGCQAFEYVHALLLERFNEDVSTVNNVKLGSLDND